ncbi:hypothetical protein EOD39_18584 [Acipenser ruthenus]|uniref:SGNH hydrolase-type esterase domain-containing protein n=1 Tax=Acipenser ruthenus TaxID=7906 RepID=A0A444U425_ACIRT|nr:hypothetical protein EOD39_18584 [Acipenser ruthenus]
MEIAFSELQMSVHTQPRPHTQLPPDTQPLPNTPAIKKTKAELALLIDSNGKYLDTRRLVPGHQVNKICCVNTEQAMQLLDRRTLGSPFCIVIHTGTNDLGSLRQHTSRAMKRVADRASLEFPDSRVVISTLLPLADTPQHMIDAINTDVHLAHHPAVGPWHLYDKVHLNKKGVGGFSRTLKDAALGRGPNSPRLNTPSRAQRSKKPTGATAPTPPSSRPFSTIVINFSLIFLILWQDILDPVAAIIPVIEQQFGDLASK